LVDAHPAKSSRANNHDAERLSDVMASSQESS
jgi:hypothetical protein